MTTKAKRAFLGWSSGKDSAWALHEIRRAGDYEIACALTTVTAPYDRVSMHGVRRALLRAQAEAVGLPLVEVEIPAPCPNEVYEQRMRDATDRLLSDGITAGVFGDLFLEDVLAYRQSRLEPLGIEVVAPLWKRDTAALAREMIAGGLRATVVCVDPRKLDPSFAGRAWDAALLDDLPAGVDPCGENGEMHTFVHDGPMFREPIPITVGEVVEREGFVFADVY